MTTVTLSYEDYKVGWICAQSVEMTAAIAMLDEVHIALQRARGDDNTYVLGRVGEHNVAIASLPIGERGTNSAAQVAVQMLRTFQSVKIGLMVGIGGGVPSSGDIRLGDIVVSKPSNQNGGVFQYDLGRRLPSGLRNFGFLNAPPRALRSAISTLVAWHDIPNQNKIPDYLSPTKNPKLPARYAYPELEPDELFKPEYIHEGHKTCANCDRGNLVDRTTRGSRDPVVHYGTIASGNQVMRNGLIRDELAARHGVLCFEMEAAGLMNTFPCVVIRGIWHYADSHKYKHWQAYAAATAAAYAKELLRFLPADQVSKTSTIVASTAQGAVSSSIDAIQAPAGLPLASASIGELALSQPEQSIPASSTASAPKLNSSGGSISSGFSVLTDGSLDWNQVVLGRLVLKLDDPAQDYYPPTPTAFGPEDIEVSPFEDIRTILNQTLGSRFIEGLKKLLFPEIDGNMNAVNEIADQTVITYKLLNPETVLNRLLEDDVTRRWLERFYNQSYIYFSVAIHSVVSPSVSKAANSLTIAQNDKSVPAMVPGDRIIGVRYRRIRFQKFCSNVDDVSLQQSGCWKIYDWNDNGGEEADSLKVTLDDTMLLDDLEDEYNFEVHCSNDTKEIYIALSTDDEGGRED